MEKPKINRDEARREIAIEIEMLRIIFQKWYDKGVDIINPKSFEYEIAVLMQWETLWNRDEKFYEIVEEDAGN